MSKVVLHSGGLDSTAALLWSLEVGEEVVPLFIRYGQAKEEEEMVRRIWERLRIRGEVVEVDMFERMGLRCRMFGNEEDDFLPNRNLLFLWIGYTYCWQNDLRELVVGFVRNWWPRRIDAVLEIADEASKRWAYPDASVEFVELAEKVLNMGGGKEVEIIAPFVGMDKKEMLEEFVDGEIDFLREWTGSCNEYNFSRWEYGYGCGKCEKCTDRKKLFDALGT